MNKNKELLGKILMILLLIFILLLGMALIFQATKKTPEMSTNLPSKIPTPTPVETRPLSRWATDSGVLEIESNLSDTSNGLKNVDLKETQLFPPVLDMQVKF